MTRTAPTGTKTAAPAPRRSATALPPTDTDNRLQALIAASDAIATAEDPIANDLITHLQGVPGTLADLGNLDSAQATNAKRLAVNWRTAVEKIIPISSGDDVQNSQVDIAIHAVLALACSALETAVG